MANGNRSTVPVGPDVIAAARQGDWAIVLMLTKPVPRVWFPDLVGLETLCSGVWAGSRLLSWLQPGPRSRCWMRRRLNWLRTGS